MFSRMNPTLRGFLIVALIALVVVVLNLYVALASLFLLAQIAFFIAIAFFVYLLWRDRREDIETWPTRAKVAFYGGALLIVVAIGAFILDRPPACGARVRAHRRHLRLRHVANLARSAPSRGLGVIPLSPGAMVVPSQGARRPRTRVRGRLRRGEGRAPAARRVLRQPS